jgi:hypothetical protein
MRIPGVAAPIGDAELRDEVIALTLRANWLRYVVHFDTAFMGHYRMPIRVPPGVSVH